MLVPRLITSVNNTHVIRLYIVRSTTRLLYLLLRAEGEGVHLSAGSVEREEYRTKVLHILPVIAPHCQVSQCMDTTAVTTHIFVWGLIHWNKGRNVDKT